MFNNLVKPVAAFRTDPDEDAGRIAEIDDNLSQWSPVPLDIREAQDLESDLDQVALFISIIREHGVTEALESYVNADGSLSTLLNTDQPLHALDNDQIVTALESLLAEYDDEPAQEFLDPVTISAIIVAAIIVIKKVIVTLTEQTTAYDWRDRILGYTTSVSDKTWSDEKAASITIKAPTAKALAEEIAMAAKVADALLAIWKNAMPATRAEFDKWAVDVAAAIAPFGPVYGVSLDKKTLFTRRAKVTVEKRDPRFEVREDTIKNLGYTRKSMDDITAGTAQVIKSIDTGTKQVIELNAALKKTNDQIKLKRSGFERFNSVRHLRMALDVSTRLLVVLMIQCSVRKTMPTMASTAGKLRAAYVSSEK